MTDEIVSFSHDANDGSYSFGFSLDGGNGMLMSLNVDVTKDQAQDIESAKTIALQAASDAKQDWLDNLSQSPVKGPVDLPISVKMAKLQAQPAKVI